MKRRGRGREEREEETREVEEEIGGIWIWIARGRRRFSEGRRRGGVGCLVDRGRKYGMGLDRVRTKEFSVVQLVYLSSSSSSSSHSLGHSRVLIRG